METLRPQDIKVLVEKIAWFLKRENMYVSSCEVREKTSKYDIYFKLEKNIAGISTIRVVISKRKPEYRVFTGKTSFDLRLKRFIQRELLKRIGTDENTSQEESSSSSGYIRRTS